MSKKNRLLKKALKEQEISNSIQSSGDKVLDRSPFIPQRAKLKNPLKINERQLTPKQQEFIDLARNKSTKLMLVSGPAGTTKTYLAVLASLLLMNDMKVSDIVYVRSIAESADIKMGSLPGEKDDKLAPYKQPLIDKLEELLSVPDVKFLSSDGRIDGLPVNYLRGLNWNAKAIIADECQNMTKEEIVTLMTRIGEFSKVFLLGDPGQSDIKSRSGFNYIFNGFNAEECRENGIVTFEFTEDDILRSALVKFIIKRLKTLK